MIWDLPTLAATEAWAGQFALLTPVPGIVYLQGDLGAGKTALARALIHALGYTAVVRSPTYTLVEEYDTPAGLILHFDLYRLLEAEELEYIGLRDYLEKSALWLVEWPERGSGYLPAPDLRVQMSLAEASAHSLQAQAESARGEGWLTALPSVLEER
ncbi:tRNA (adenosine(37)-N6)-threonylcarbamoyltransferase complex ATPase subunit type 1 TsaE [Acidithiobacillus sp. IBUN Pt1247-S3]|uniref:tRNA (adenosine(37)-N6)-threonylcarbamoyltransferase complex ATPase subunit type 1 TsaE n=1 Tax=Acidithiobacillus sp. IBUN Pt1247-S3 TaxID=3166642 RepID=UPI0034E46875